MLMKQIIDAYEVLDSSFVTGEAVKEYLLGIKEDAKHMGGINIFGKEFGNFHQDILMTLSRS